MSSRPLQTPFPVIINASMTTNVISLPTNIQNISMIGYDLSWTGAPVGTFSVQVSNTYQQSGQGVVINAGHWTTLTLSAAVTASGTPGNAFIDVDALSGVWIRLVYTATSGTGVLNATVAGKVA
jgi:hypothetical protein